MKRILKIYELPSKIKEIKKHIYYVLTQGNLYCLTKNEHQITQKYYKHSYSRPRLMAFEVLLVQNKFSIVLIVEGGIMQFVDPFSL